MLYTYNKVGNELFSQLYAAMGEGLALAAGYMRRGTM